jgi:signal transduction histidine kinase
MFRVRDYSITRKLTWMNMLVSGAALLLACGAFIAYETVLYRQGMVRNLSVEAQIIGANSVSALLFNDPQSAEATLAALRASSHVTSAWIYTPEGRPFAGYWRDRNAPTPALPRHPTIETDSYWFKDGQLGLVHSVIFQQKLTAIVYIQSDLAGLYDRLSHFVQIGVGVMLACLLAAFSVSWISRKSIAKPIQDLSETARIVSRDKNFAVRAAPAKGRDEISVLIESFNGMLAQIQERDVALQKARDHLEIRVEERTAELAATNKELEAFTYSVSHDLRAPLRRIDGFSKLVLEETNAADLSDDAKRYISYIRTGAQEMGHLVDDLLNLSRVSRKELSVQVTGLSSLVEGVVADLNRDNPGRAVEWLIRPLPFVDCDPTLMRQVFVNLLSNAVKYSRPRSPAVIEVGTSEQDGEPVIFVKDNGVGFSMKYVDKLFGVFQRLHRAEDFEGTGVGLATVQRIVHKHGGRVWAEAALDRGATFYFSIHGKNHEG